MTDRTPTPRARTPDAIDEALRALQRSLDAHREESRERQKATDLRLAEIGAVVDRLDRHHAATEAVARATEVETTLVRQTPARIEEVVRRLDAVESRIADGVARPVWADENGRRVIWWTLAAMVLCSLAIGGGLTFADLRGHFIAGGTAGFDHPPPMRAPAPPTHPAHRPLPDHPREDQL